MNFNELKEKYNEQFVSADEYDMIYKICPDIYHIPVQNNITETIFYELINEDIILKSGKISKKKNIHRTGNWFSVKIRLPEVK